MISLLLRLIPLFAFVYGAWTLWGAYSNWKDVDRPALDNQVAALSTRLESIKTKISRGEEFKLIRDKKLLELRQLTEVLKEKENSIPVEKVQMASVIKTIADLADKTGVEINSIKPQESKDIKNLIIYPLDFKIKGSYIQLMSFLDFISKQDRVFVADKINIQAPQKSKFSLPLDTELTVNAYQLKLSSGEDNANSSSVNPDNSLDPNGNDQVPPIENEVYDEP